VSLGSVKGTAVRPSRGATGTALDRDQAHATLGAERHGAHLNEPRVLIKVTMTADEWECGRVAAIKRALLLA